MAKWPSAMENVEDCKFVGWIGSGSHAPSVSLGPRASLFSTPSPPHSKDMIVACLRHGLRLHRAIHTPALPIACTTFTVSRKAPACADTTTHLLGVSRGDRVVQRKAMPPLLHRPGSAVHPHTHGFSRLRTAVPGLIETRCAFCG